MARLSGKVAIVTGAAQGIGRAIADGFSDHGAIVYYTDREMVAGADGRFINLDVTNEADWKGARDIIKRDHGRIDILVNNAGLELLRPISEISLADWRSIMSVNVDGVFLGCRVMEDLLIESCSLGLSPSVINMSSVVGIVGYQDQLAYNASKGAVRSLSKSMAIEWAHHGYRIRVNSIHPGYIRTPKLDEAVENWVRQGKLPAVDPWSQISALCPLNLIGDASDVAMGAIYLASDESRYVTGIELVIDGGFTAR